VYLEGPRQDAANGMRLHHVVLKIFGFALMRQFFLLRIPDDKMHKPHKECTNMAEKASPTGKNKFKLGVS